MNTAKPLSLLLAFAALVMPLTSCSGNTAETGYSSLEMAEIVMGTQPNGSDAHRLTLEDEEFGAYLSEYYHIEKDALVDGAISYLGGADASEVAIFGLRDSTDAPALEEALLNYIDTRTGDFVGYMPDQVFILEHAVVTSNGSYVAMLICEDAEGARQAFTGCFAEAPAPSQETGLTPSSLTYMGSTVPVKDSEAYDAAAIITAWKTGDDSHLFDKNKAVLEAGAQVIDEVVTNGMSAYEKELAIHDWIIRRAEYDTETVNRAPNAKPNPDNDNPYGLLIDGRAICLGYTSTFQPFMDLLDIECQTIHGTAHDSENEHAWNMVRLDGEWYCVDITWNDPVGLDGYDEVVQHKYFNVTSRILRRSDHQWNEDAVPEATATAYRWKSSESATPFGLRQLSI